ncbi:MAG: acetylxylan esterase [Acidothermus sp.]|nr:acetylxylan esterase [Acidothermus sp.]
MPNIDLPFEQLLTYAPHIPEPPDLDDFWRETLAEVGDPQPVVTPHPNGLRTVESYDVTFRGFGGHPIRAWLHLPARPLRTEPLPGVVQFQGYNGGRGLVHEHVFWANAGYAHLVVDTRGQGSGWTTGDTGDGIGTSPSQPGFMTRGIDDPRDYFYRRVYVDAVQAVRTLRAQPMVDPARVAVTGISQGGGISIAVAALVPDVAAVMPDVPFLCHFRRACEISPSDPYGEIVRYLKAHRDRVDRVFSTLAYFDGAVLARRATAPALFSVALMDQICPPSTVYAAYHAYRGPKEIAVYPYNDHEGGGPFQQGRQLTWIAGILGRVSTAPEPNARVAPTPQASDADLA